MVAVEDFSSAIPNKKRIYKVLFKNVKIDSWQAKYERAVLIYSNIENLAEV